MTSANVSDFLLPPCHVHISADFVASVCFFGSPLLSTHCRRHIWKPLITNDCNLSKEFTNRFLNSSHCCFSCWPRTGGRASSPATRWPGRPGRPSSRMDSSPTSACSTESAGMSVMRSMGNYCTPARGIREIILPEGHIMPPKWSREVVYLKVIQF